VRTPFAQAGIGSDGTREVSAGIGGGEQWRYSLLAGYFLTDGIPTNVSFTENHGYQNSHFVAGIEGELAAGVQLRLDASHAEGTSEFDANTGDEDFRNQVFSAQLIQHVSERWTQRLTLGHALDRYETFSPTSPATITTRRNSLAWQHDLVLHQGGVTTLGMDFWRDDAQKDRSGIIDQSLDTTALFIQHQWQVLGADWLLGLRHDRHERFGSKTTGHIAWGLDFGDALRATASYGTAFKAPTVNDLFWPYRVDTFAGNTYITEGNPDLNPESSRSLEFGLAYKPSAAASMAINLYRTRIDDLIEWQSSQTGPLEYTYRPQNVSAASIKGAEVVAAVKRGDWDMGATLTWQKAEDDATGRQLDRRPRRKATFGLGRPIGKGHIRAEWLVASERNDRTGSVRLDGYGIVNLAYRRPLADQLELQARVENLFDKDYVLASSYSGDYNSLGRSLFLGLRYSPK
jgi:vitamin B12 transporter